MVSRVIPVDPFDLVIFGGTGDLARRKILPGLFRRFCAGQMPENARIIGAARTEMDRAGYQQMIREAIAEFNGDFEHDKAQLEGFIDRLEYVAIDAKGEDGWAELQKLMAGTERVEAYYFSVSPALFGDLAERLQQWGMADAQSRSAATSRPRRRSTPRWPSILTKARSTGSTIIWAKRRCKT